MTWKEEKMLLYKTKRYLQKKNFTPSSTEKNISYDTRENNSKMSRNKQFVIILGDSPLLLNDWKKTKKIQSNFKVYVKTFSRPTVSCMEDYIKPFLRNSPRSFHFTCWYERSIL